METNTYVALLRVEKQLRTILNTLRSEDSAIEMNDADFKLAHSVHNMASNIKTHVVYELQQQEERSDVKLIEDNWAMAKLLSERSI